MSPANAEWHTLVRKLLDGPIVATMVDYRLSCTLRSFTGPALVDQLSVMASSVDGPMDTSIAVWYGVWVKVRVRVGGRVRVDEVFFHRRAHKRRYGYVHGQSHDRPRALKCPWCRLWAHGIGCCVLHGRPSSSMVPTLVASAFD